MLPFDNINIGNLLDVIESVISVQPPNKVTPTSEFRIPLLEALVEMGGSGGTSNLYNRIEAKMKNRLMPGDYEKLSDGTVRWKNSAWCERCKLKDEGLLRSDSPRVWEISDEGRAYLEKAKKEG